MRAKATLVNKHLRHHWTSYSLVFTIFGMMVMVGYSVIRYLEIAG
jgi:hypothetical protein